MPTLSLIIPVLNEEDAIAACLDAVVAQTRPVDECIIVDNNCTDRTMDIVQTYSDRLPLRLISETRPGLVWARERGFEVATGEVLGRIDADTRLEPEWAAHADAFFLAHPDVGGVSGPSYPYDMPFRGWFERRVRAAGGSEHADGHPQDNLYGANMLVRKDAWLATRDLQVKDTRLLEDVDLYLAFKKGGYTAWLVPKLFVGQSFRRIKSSPISILRYLLAAPHTYWKHGERGAAVKSSIGIPIALTTSTLLSMVLLPYDINTQTWSWRHIFAGEARMSPVN